MDIDGPYEEDEQGLANTRAGTPTLPQDLGGVFNISQLGGAKMVWSEEDRRRGNGGRVNGGDEDDEDEDDGDGDGADDDADNDGDDGGIRNGNGKSNGSNSVLGGDPGDPGACGDHGYYRAVDDEGGDSGVPARAADDGRKNARDAGWVRAPEVETARSNRVMPPVFSWLSLG